MAPERSHPRIPPELEAVAERVGEFIRYWGFKRVHGRIWAHLYLSEHPLDAAELMRRLGISKALVSISLADLMRYSVLEEAGRSDYGTQLYRANPALIEVILGVLRRRERQLLAQASSAFGLLRKVAPAQRQAAGIDVARVETVHELVKAAEDGLDGLIALSLENPGQLAQLKELAQAVRPD